MVTNSQGQVTHLIISTILSHVSNTLATPCGAVPQINDQAVNTTVGSCNKVYRQVYFQPVWPDQLVVTFEHTDTTVKLSYQRSKPTQVRGLKRKVFMLMVPDFRFSVKSVSLWLKYHSSMFHAENFKAS